MIRLSTGSTPKWTLLRSDGDHDKGNNSNNSARVLLDSGQEEEEEESGQWEDRDGRARPVCIPMSEDNLSANAEEAPGMKEARTFVKVNKPADGKQGTRRDDENIKVPHAA